MSGDTGEPLLTVRRPPTPFFLRRRFLRVFAPLATLAMVGMIALTSAGTVALPFEQVVTLEAKMGSKVDFFDDPEVQRLLLRHHIRVHVSRMGSRDVAAGELDSFDFVFPSGQPTAQLIANERRAAGRYYTIHRPFVSPVVLATYREYAHTLTGPRADHAATAQPSAGEPYYFDLDLAKFIKLLADQRTWDDLGIGAHGVTNGNTVQGQTSSVCTSNASAAYLGLVSYAVNGKAPASTTEATDFATKIKPLLRGQGLAVSAPTELYFVDEGRQTAPIIAIYEHQFLAHQLRKRERSGSLDRDRVLLYPRMAVQSQPELIALTPEGDALGRLISTDPDLRRRALELGFRVLDPTGDSASGQLSGFLAERQVPEPSTRESATRALMPDVPYLETMISIVGDCPPLGGR